MWLGRGAAGRIWDDEGVRQRPASRTAPGDLPSSGTGHPQILPRDDESPEHSGLKQQQGPELLVVQGGQGAPCQPGDRVNNHQ